MQVKLALGIDPEMIPVKVARYSHLDGGEIKILGHEYVYVFL